MCQTITILFFCKFSTKWHWISPKEIFKDYTHCLFCNSHYFQEPAYMADGTCGQKTTSTISFKVGLQHHGLRFSCFGYSDVNLPKKMCTQKGKPFKYCDISKQITGEQVLLASFKQFYGIGTEQVFYPQAQFSKRFRKYNVRSWVTREDVH